MNKLNSWETREQALADNIVKGKTYHCVLYYDSNLDF
jgi:hypothetical protein